MSHLTKNWDGCSGKGCTKPPVTYEINITDNDQDTDGDGIVDTSDPDDDGDNITDKVEDGGPNKGDGNNDGVLDSLQNGVTTLLSSVTGEYQTMAIESGCKQNQVVYYDITSESSNVSQDSQRDYALGMNNFIIDCGSKAVTVTIDFYYDKVYDTSAWEYIKYDTILDEYRVVDSAAYQYLTLNNGDTDVTVVRLTLTEGGEYDMDGETNGMVVDPSSPTFPIETTTASKVNNPAASNTPNTGFGTAVYASLYSAAFVVTVGYILRKLAKAEA